MKCFTLSGFFVLFLSCSKSNVNETEIPVSKTIEFRVAQATDYSAPVYDGVQAEVHLTVSKQIAGSIVPVVLWDTLIPYQSLRAYPSAITPLLVSKQFSGLFKNTETIRFSKVVRYKTSSNQITFKAVGEDVPSSVNSKLVDVNL